jgi:hypothetical protein
MKVKYKFYAFLHHRSVSKPTFSRITIVWNHTNEERVILLIDLWHPDLQVEEIQAIEEMFGEAKKKGWIK